MPAAKFRKKPVVIEAIQFTGEPDNYEDILDFSDNQFRLLDDEDRGDDPDVIAEVWDQLHSTWVGVKLNQWVIRGVQGEVYPCDADVFESTYEAVDASS